jgi:photosystem II stability/assembly factor-like uncharacterized protein
MGRPPFRPPVRRILPPLALSLMSVATLAAQSPDSTFYGRLRYRPIGPPGNRAIAVVGVPGNPLVAFVGAASGGVFKTIDGGVNWRPVFDDQDVSSVGALAIDREHPNTLWAGTGETFFIRPETSIGDGIYRSTDQGETWQHMGLEKTGRIGRIVVDPQNSDIVFACAEGTGFGPQQDRGVFRTRDGGKTWQRVLFADENTGCSDLDIDPRDPQVLFAGMWPLLVRPWNLASGGTSGGVYVSRDGGDSWQKIVGHGLPAAADSVGKVAVRVAPSDPDVVYALVQQHEVVLYRSDDNGRTWHEVSRDHSLAERPGYYVRFAIDPSDANHLFFVSVKFSESVDGGRTITSGFGAGGDNHDVWIDPLDPDRRMVANDGGVTITLNGGKTFNRVVLPIAQLYHAYTDNQVPYNVYGNRQDDGSWEIPSNSLTGGGIPLGMMHSVGGCESGFSVPDTAGGDVVYSGCYDGGLTVYDPKTRQARDITVWPEATWGWPPADVRDRWHWTFPITISPHDHTRVYVGSQYVYQSTNQGQSWQRISPDLTTNDKAHEQSSGGLTIDNLETFDGAVLYAIAESPVQAGLVWAGSNDGLVHVTRDDGKTWQDVTPKGMPPYSTVENIEPSRWAAAMAYMAVDAHQMNDFTPYIYETTDFGKTWKLISGDLPHSVFSYVHVVREDPHRRGMLWAGTENSVYFSLHDGVHWMPLRNDMPPAPVYWLTIQPHFNDLVVATYGRGFYIMDDVTPLEALNDSVLAADAYLFQPRSAYRFNQIYDVADASNNAVVARNPRYGADIDVYFKSAPKKAELAVLDASGNVIRSLEVPDRAGLDRVWWDLQYAASVRPKLRTPSPGEPWVRTGESGTRAIVQWDLDSFPGLEGPRVAPGTYTIRLTVDGRTTTRTLTVLKDPHSAGSVQDIQAQVAFGLKVRGDIDDVARMIDRLEWTKTQLTSLQELLKTDSTARSGAGATADSLIHAAALLHDSATAVESALFDVHLTGAREDAFRNPVKLYGRLSALNTDLLAAGQDFPPTDQQEQVRQLLEQRLASARQAVQHFYDVQVAAFKSALHAANVPDIIAQRGAAVGGPVPGDGPGNR